MPAERIEPLTAERWADLERLFGPSGAYGGCWCMWWRLRSSEFSAATRDQRREALHARARQDPPPGLLAYDGEVPVGWVALAPREEYGRLQRSPKLRPVDDVPVWAVTCFFVARRHRGQGVAAALLHAAVAEAGRRGAAAVEGYPIDTSEGRAYDAAVFTGTLDLFTTAGFSEVARRGGRPIVRRRLT